MYLHANAKLGLAGRLALVRSIEGGCSIRAAAASFSVSPATAHRWWKRWRAASDLEHMSLACLLDRSSRPARSPRRLAPECERAICDCRRKTGWGPRLVAGATGFAHSTVWKVLRRFGLSRPPRPHESGRIATSGRARATCCTWMSPATLASCVLAIAPLAIARIVSAAG
jgi:transposase